MITEYDIVWARSFFGGRYERAKAKVATALRYDLTSAYPLEKDLPEKKS